MSFTFTPESIDTEMNLNNPIWNQFKPLLSTVNRAIYKRTLVAAGSVLLHTCMYFCIRVGAIRADRIYFCTDCPLMTMCVRTDVDDVTAVGYPVMVPPPWYVVPVDVETAIHTSDKFNYTLCRMFKSVRELRQWFPVDIIGFVSAQEN